MRIIRLVMKVWLPLAAAITMLAGTIYIAVQQAYRQGANDPQIQMAEDAATALAAGQPVNNLVPAGTVDMAQSLAPYLIVYDQNGTPLASNVLLHGAIPQIPAGVFDYTRQHGEDRISWQPEPGVRSAAVIYAVTGSSGGFVLAGRSLREVEKREDQLTQQVSAGWLSAMLISLVVVVVAEILLGNRTDLNKPRP